MRIHLIIIIHITSLTSVNLLSQIPEWISGEFPNSLICNITENDSGIICALTNATTDPEFSSNLIFYTIKLDSESVSILSLDLIHAVNFADEFYTHSIRYIAPLNLWIAVQSKTVMDYQRIYRVVLLDSNMNIVAETSALVTGRPVTFHIDSDDHNTYILGSILGPPENQVFFHHFNHSNPQDLSPIDIKQNIPQELVYITSMQIDDRTGNLLLFSLLGISILNETLEIISSYNSTEVLTQDFGHLIGVDDFYYSHGARDSAWDIGFHNIVLHKYDTNFVILKADTLGWHGRDNHVFIFNSIEYQNGELLVGGHLDGPYTNFNFFESQKKFYLAKYDLELNQLWRKEYGGDRAYILTGLKLLRDKSCLAYGFITDSLDGYRYAYIMHVDANGDIISSTSFPSQPSTIRVVNPGDENIVILNPDQIDATISVFDLNGRFVLSGSIPSTNSTFTTSHLPAGIYPYTIVAGDRIIDSGKWVKRE